MKKNTFRKQERLCSKKHIEELFAGDSQSFTAYPLRVVFASMEGTEESTQDNFFKVLISVSKRHFKHAVSRNRIKRLIREAWRLNKHILTESVGTQRLMLAFIWMSDKTADYATITSSVKSLLPRVAENLQQQ